MKIIVFVCTILIHCSLTASQQLDQPTSSLITPARLCRNAEVEQVRVVNLTSRPTVFFNSTSEKLDVYLTINWEVQVPEGLVLDGYVFRMDNDTDQSLDIADIETPICNTRFQYVWMNTTDGNCLNSSSVCGSDFNFPIDYKLCPLTYFPQDPPYPCAGTGNTFIRKRGFMNIPKVVTELTYKIEFYTQYLFHLNPYYQQFVNIQLPLDISHQTIFHLSAVSDCPNILSRTTGMSIREATSKCCEQGIPHHLVRNVTFGEPEVDIEKKSINITITWLPPIDANNLTIFQIFPFATVAFSAPKQTKITSHPLTDNEKQMLASCDKTSLYYKVEMYNLQPSTYYEIAVKTIYQNDSEKKETCHADTCTVFESLLMPDVNLCDPVLHYCIDIATCFTESNTFNVTCKCPNGYHGNGINITKNNLATGCNDLFYCAPELNPCADHSRCEDLLAPLPGANCTCLPGYSGDGYTYCRSDVGIGLGVAIPILLVLFLLFGVIARRYYRVQKLKNDLKWSQFVSNDTLRTYTMINNLVFEKADDECLPTFGEKWELERSKLTIENILGRGNYGIVYQAYLEQINDDGLLVETRVAVKSVKEGADDAHHLAEFLAEIGFMLNIGSHPNILGVIGCCTTQKPVYLITDLLKYGDLLHFLWNAREPTKSIEDPIYHLTEKSLYHIGKQIAEGMDFLTKSRIIHGDIAARNILVGENLSCKISDFGLANDVYRYGVIQGQSERCVPLKWISPERMMAGKVPITSKSDVWSFGILLYEMVTLGCMPHADIQSDQLLKRLKAGYRMKKPSTSTEKMYSIMSKCWKWRPYSRPSFFELVSLLDDALNEKVPPSNYVNLTDAVEELNIMAYEDEIKDEKKKHGNYHASDDLEVKQVEEILFKDRILPESSAYTNLNFDHHI